MKKLGYDHTARVIAVAAQIRLIMPIAIKCEGMMIAHLLESVLEECDRVIKEDLDPPEMTSSEITALERRLALFMNNTRPRGNSPSDEP